MNNSFSKQYYGKALDLLKKAAVIPSPSGKEDKRVEFIMNCLRKDGIGSAYTDEAKNVIIPYNDDGANGLDVFAAHTDVVFPDLTPLPLSVEGNIMRSPGIGDNTAHFVSLMMYAHYFFSVKPKTGRGILFVLNSSEEGTGNLLGVRTLFKNYGHRIRTFTSFDQSLDKGIVNTAVGSERYRIKAETEGGHSYFDFGKRSAIDAITSLVQRFYRQDPPEGTTYNVGTIAGGTGINTIAQEAECTYEFRSANHSDLRKMREEFEKILFYMNDDDVKITADPIGIRPCGVETDTKWLEQKAEKALSAFSYPAFRTSSSTDCNIPLSMGIPAICFGLVKYEGMHTRNEFIYLDSYVHGLDIGLNYILDVTEAQTWKNS